EWREAPPDAPQAPGGMSRAEAFEVLGLDFGASQDDVREAYRRLMVKLHPDHGGSSYLAAKLNQARDLLLNS
ncbi:MAG: DnaJ domain-containing protein, partial [Alphaproteobacteria bacterium]|nr:DnaJ domain-containing protein [Alphaproteobacteria bacterium]